MSVPELQIVSVPVGSLEPNEWNPNRQDERTFQAERESIRAYGFIDPVTVRAHPEQEGRWQIIDGEHRWRAAQEEGLETITIIPISVTDAAAKKLTVILNETRGDPDVAMLGKLLAEIEQEVSEDEFRLGLPYSDAELSHLTELGAVDWDDFNPGGETPQDPGDDERREIVLRYSDEQFDRFHTFAAILRQEFEAEDTAIAVLAGMELVAKQVNQT